MAWSGSEPGTEKVFRHPLNAMTRLSERTPLRVKLIAALLALVALALTVISFTSIVVFRGYLLNQADKNVQTLVAQSANGAPPSPHQTDMFTLLVSSTRSSIPTATWCPTSATARRWGQLVPISRRVPPGCPGTRATR